MAVPNCTLYCTHRIILYVSYVVLLYSLLPKHLSIYHTGSEVLSSTRVLKISTCGARPRPFDTVHEHTVVKKNYTILLMSQHRPIAVYLVLRYTIHLQYLYDHCNCTVLFAP